MDKAVFRPIVQGPLHLISLISNLDVIILFSVLDVISLISLLGNFKHI